MLVLHVDTLHIRPEALNPLVQKASSQDWTGATQLPRLETAGGSLDAALRRCHDTLVAMRLMQEKVPNQMLLEGRGPPELVDRLAEVEVA